MIYKDSLKATRYYMDEFHLLLKEEQTAAYSVEIWKRFRKWGGIPTGITQNVKDLLSSREVENIFEKADVIEMLNNVMAGKYYGNTYIPIRIGTPSVLIYWAEKRRGDIIDNNPIAMSAEKAYQAMARKGHDIDGRPHELSPNDIVAIVEAMSNPEYIVYQGANGRYVEVVSYDTNEGKKALAVLEIGDYKPEWTMNGYEKGMYNILVTTYPPDQGVVADLLRNKTNQVIYDKKKDAPRGTPGSNVPSVSNDASFYKDMIPHEEPEVKKHSDRDADGNQLSEDQQEFFKDSKVRDKDGNLLVMYHGTAHGGHTVFDTYGSEYGLFGAGSYFTDKEESLCLSFSSTPMVTRSYC